MLAEVTDLSIELRVFLSEHLAIEDADVLPLFEQYFWNATLRVLEDP